MIAALALAALVLAPERRVADFHVGATNGNEHLLAIEADRAITYRVADATLRAVPLDDAAKATTIATGVSNDPAAVPIAAPPLIAWTVQNETHIAPIDEPDGGSVLPRIKIQSMKCNATACLATTESELLFLRLDGTIYARKPEAGVVLTSDRDGFLLRSSYSLLKRVDNNGAVTFSTIPPAPVAFDAAADFDGARYAIAWADESSGSTATLRALAVSLDGVAGAPVKLVALPTRRYGRMALAYNGGRHLLVFGNPDTNPSGAFEIPRTRLCALRLDGALQPLDAKPFIVDETTWADVDAAVIARGNEFLAGWTHRAGSYSDDPEAAVVDFDGKARPRMLLSRGVAEQHVGSVATVPGALVVSYVEFPQEEGGQKLRVRRFAPDGTPLGDPITVRDGADSALMAARDGDVLIVSFRTSTMDAAILRADGSLQHVDLPWAWGGASVAASRNGWMLVVSGGHDVTAIRIDATGNASAPQTIVHDPFTDFRAAVASDGDRFLVAWASSGGSSSRLCTFQPCGTRATLLDATGGKLKVNIVLTSGFDLSDATFAGGEYFVATTTGVRVSRDGDHLDDVNVHASRVTSLGATVLATEERSDSTRLVVLDHGTAIAETTVSAPAPAICPGAVAYSVKVGDAYAAVFRSILTERRRSAYH